MGDLELVFLAFKEAVWSRGFPPPPSSTPFDRRGKKRFWKRNLSFRGLLPAFFVLSLLSCSWAHPGHVHDTAILESGPPHSGASPSSPVTTEDTDDRRLPCPFAPVAPDSLGRCRGMPSALASTITSSQLMCVNSGSCSRTWSAGNRLRSGVVGDEGKEEEEKTTGVGPGPAAGDVTSGVVVVDSSKSADLCTMATVVIFV